MSGEIQIVETRESEQFQLLQGGKVAFYFDCELAIWAFIHGRIFIQWMYFGDAILAGDFRLSVSRSIIQLTPQLFACGTLNSTRRKRGSVGLKFIHWTNCSSAEGLSGKFIHWINSSQSIGFNRKPCGTNPRSTSSNNPLTTRAKTAAGMAPSSMIRVLSSRSPSMMGPP
jgi:hypothetical protein